MFVNISVHNIEPGKESVMLDSMRRYASAAVATGAREAHELRDELSGKLIGLAIWDSKATYESARPALAEAVAGDDFDAWHDGPMTVYHCLEA